MHEPTIYRTETMATRALAAEIRHQHQRFAELLERVSGTRFGRFQTVRCEVKHKVDGGTQPTVRIDVELEFEEQRVGIEAKLDHELTRPQVEDQLLVLGPEATLFVLMPKKDAAPRWLADYPEVFLIDWAESLGCFDDSRLTMDDIHGEGRLLKSTVEAWFSALDLGQRMPGWEVDVHRGGSGMPSIEFRSPPLRDGKQLRGQIEVVGRGMPGSLTEIRFNSYVGISVNPTDEADFPNPEESTLVPSWIAHLQLLHREVLEGEEQRLRINRRAPGPGKKELGARKVPLAKRYLKSSNDGARSLAYLAKGYTDWAIGPKLQDVPKEELEELAAITVEIFHRWYAAEMAE
ncbi:hypothetical protein PFZ49_12605 [Microbacterium lacticum]|uniref:hypothetical protein n=1 Tax=Microbacterium lacticum TaxID=33885 RepID=UPI003A8775AE